MSTPFAESPWLQAPFEQWATTLRSGRMPHAVLLVGPRGIGKRRVADWIAAAALCEASHDPRPCGACSACMLVDAGSHPDLKLCSPEDDATSIKVEQIRALGDALSTKSYRGGRKVAILDPADAMTHSSFNALLKTLEEPSADTLLLLTVARLERVPVTIASRCQRLRIRTPGRDAALAWLNSRQRREDWPLLLDLSAGVPHRALAAAASGDDRLYREVATVVLEGVSDVPALGEAWAKDRPDQRLSCLEHVLVDMARQSFASEPVNNSRRGSLPSSGRLPDIASVVRTLDVVREARGRLDGPANTTMLFETLLVRLRQVSG